MGSKREKGYENIEKVKVSIKTGPLVKECVITQKDGRIIKISDGKLKKVTLRIGNCIIGQMEAGDITAMIKSVTITTCKDNNTETVEVDIFLKGL